MIKLYKKKDSTFEYAEYWLNEEENLIYIHQGVVGEKGSYKTEVCKSEEKFKKEFIKKFNRLGYYEIPDEKMYWVVVQYFFYNELNESSVKSLYDFLSSEFNELLGWTGLGEVDGFDFGESTNPNKKGYCLNIFNVVVDEKIALKLLKKNLHKEYGDATPLVAWRSGSGDDEYHFEDLNEKFYL